MFLQQSIVMVKIAQSPSTRWCEALVPSNIIAGFQKCGIYPFNRNAIPYLDNSSSTAEESSPKQKHDLAVDSSAS